MEELKMPADVQQHSSPAATGGAPPLAPQATTTSGRILLVDDEPAILRVYTRILSESGYTIECASGGAQALEHLARESFDVIVSDIAMPGMTGIQLLRAVRSRDLDVPVILATGNPQTDTAVQA